MPISVLRFDNNPVSSSCYLIRDEITKRILIVDPGSEDMSINISNELGEYIDRIILTHAHFDHCWGCNDLNNRFKIPIWCSQRCAEFIPERKKNLSVFYNQIGFSVENKVLVVQDRKLVEWNGNKIYFFYTPGHSSCSMCFIIGKYLFTGDTLLENIRTVTKLKDGSKEALLESINLLRNLQGKGYIVCPGHGQMFNLDTYDLKKAIK